MARVHKDGWVQGLGTAAWLLLYGCRRRCGQLGMVPNTVFELGWAWLQSCF